MPRKRMIDPNFWSSQDVASLSHFERLILIGLFSNADDYGKGYGKPEYIRSIIFPYEDIPTKKVSFALENIERNISIRFYFINGCRYYQFTNWKKWQKFDHPVASVIPEPLDDDLDDKTETEGDGFANHSRTIREHLAKPSRNPREPIPQNSAQYNRTEVNRIEENRIQPGARVREDDAAAEIGRVIQHFDDALQIFPTTGGTLEFIKDKLSGGMSSDVLIAAIDETAIQEKVRSRPKYFQGIVANWWASGIRTMDELNAYRARGKPSEKPDYSDPAHYAGSNEEVPEWAK